MPCRKISKKMVNRTPQLFPIGDVSRTSGQNVKVWEDMRGSVSMGTDRVSATAVYIMQKQHSRILLLVTGG